MLSPAQRKTEVSRVTMSSGPQYSVSRSDTERLRTELEGKKRQLARLEAELEAQNKRHEAQRNKDELHHRDREEELQTRLREQESLVAALRERTALSTSDAEGLRLKCSRLESQLREAGRELASSRELDAQAQYLASNCDRLQTENAELQLQLENAMAANQTAVLEGKVEALNTVITEQIAKIDQQALNITDLLEEIESGRLERQRLQQMLAASEQRDAEWIAVTDELRYRLRRQEEDIKIVKDTNQKEIAVMQRHETDRDKELASLMKELDDAQDEMRALRRQAHARDVQLEESYSLVQESKREIEALRRDLGEARRELERATERLKESYSDRENIELKLARELTLSQALSQEVQHLKVSKLSIEKMLEDTRDDLHRTQKTLEDERSHFNVEYHKLVATFPSAGSSEAAGPRHAVLSPQRPVAV